MARQVIIRHTCDACGKVKDAPVDQSVGWACVMLTKSMDICPDCSCQFTPAELDARRRDRERAFAEEHG